MHKCLAVDDIFSIILDYAGGWDDFDLSTAGFLEVVDDYEFHSPFNTGPLYSLALTCQTFKEAALTRLWSRQRCLDNLLKLLPLDLFAKPRDSYFWVDFYTGPGDEWPFQRAPCEILDFKRPPTERDWDRFDYYARRVVKLVADFNQCGKLAPSLAVLEALRARSRPILPNIKHLTWSLSSMAMDCPMRCMLYFDVFMGPKVRYLKISTGAEDFRKMPRDEEGFPPEDMLRLDRISALTPHVQFLDLDLWGTHALKDSLPAVIAPLTNLQWLYLRFCDVPFTQRILDTLATLPSLVCLTLWESTTPINRAPGVQEYLSQTLHLDVNNSLGSDVVPIMDPADSEAWPPLTRTRFPALKKLELSSEAFDTSACVLDGMDLPVLESLTFCLWRYPDHATLHMFLHALPACCTTPSLRELVLRQEQCVALRERCTELTCHELRMVAESYPRLRKLQMAWYMDEAEEERKGERVEDVKRLLPELDWDDIVAIGGDSDLEESEDEQENDAQNSGDDANGSDVSQIEAEVEDAEHDGDAQDEEANQASDHNQYDDEMMRAAQFLVALQRRAAARSRHTTPSVQLEYEDAGDAGDADRDGSEDPGGLENSDTERLSIPETELWNYTSDEDYSDE